MRVMAVDYGDVRTGVAISDSGNVIAGEVMVIKEYNNKVLAQRLKALAESRGVGTLVLGYPLNMDGSRGERAEKSEELAGLLAGDDLEVVLQDERRTTVDAYRILSKAGKRGKKRRETVDAVAASLILETYLNRSDTLK